MKRRVAEGRLESYFLQQILVLLLVLPLKLQLVSQQIWLQRLWLAVSEARLPGQFKKNMADAADGEDEFEAVDQSLQESQKFSLYKDLEGYRSLWDTLYVPSKNKHQNKLQKQKKA